MTAVGAFEPALLLWFESERTTDSGLTWIRHEIDNDSGVGMQVVANDITGDGRADVVVSNKKGVFVFVQE